MHFICGCNYMKNEGNQSDELLFEKSKMFVGFDFPISKPLKNLNL